MITVPEKFVDILQSNALAYVATTGPKDTPHVSPVWFVWDGEKILLSMTRTKQKVRNMLRKPGISIAITDPKNAFRSLEIRGTAHCEDDPEFRFAHLITRKYTGHDAPPEMILADEGRVVIAVTPEKLLVFAPEQTSIYD